MNIKIAISVSNMEMENETTITEEKPFLKKIVKARKIGNCLYFLVPEAFHESILGKSLRYTLTAKGARVELLAKKMPTNLEITRQGLDVEAKIIKE